MRIGELSRATGVSARSLRYYEQRGLITSRRRPNGYRDYDPSAVETVASIKSLLALGFPATLVADVLPCALAGANTKSCSDIISRIVAIRNDMDRKAKDLLAARDSLTAILEQAGRES